MTFLLKKPKVAPLPAPPPAAPTIDEAALREEATRRFSRRKGRMAALKAGAGAQANTTVKTLLAG